MKFSTDSGDGLLLPDAIREVDRIPASPSPFDEEFDRPLSTGWLVLDSGASANVTYDINKTFPSCYYANMGAIGAHSPGHYKPCPPIPFTVTVKIADSVWALSSGGPTPSAPGNVMLGEATPGKFIVGSIDCAENGYLCLVGGTWTNPTTFSANIGTYTSGGSGVGSASRLANFAYNKPHYTRFAVHSTSNVDGYVSWDGRNWTKWLSAYNPGFTIGSVGLAPSAVSGAGVYDWMRFTQP